jgi:hypothetical protein
MACLPDVRGKTNGWDGRAVPVEVQYGSAAIQRRRVGAIMTIDAPRVTHQRKRYWKLFGVVLGIPDTVCQITRADFAARVARKWKDYGNTRWDATSAAIAEIGH